MKRGGPLKRSTPLRTTKPMARGTSTLKTTKPLVAKKPMARGTSQLARPAAPMRAKKRVADKPKRAARDAAGAHYLALCRGQPCYLLAPGVLAHPIETVVPCHSNALEHGKGMGLKALHEFTVPGCMHCHHAIDQSGQFTREEKFALWDAAYARWEPVRAALLAQQQK